VKGALRPSKFIMKYNTCINVLISVMYYNGYIIVLNYLFVCYRPKSLWWSSRWYAPILPILKEWWVSEYINIKYRQTIH